MRFLATEKLSEHKYKTPEGYLVCVDAVLSRTGKQQYRRAELFGDSCERADELIDVDRLEADVFDEKAMASFENKPICVEHPDEDVNVANHNDLAVGFVRDIKRGTDNGQPVMLGTLVITDENAIDLVESGEYNELSCGYDCDIADDEHPMQRNIRGNHVALCKQGRAGIARIVDSMKDSLVSADKLEIGMRINYRGKLYTVEAVTSNEQYKGEYDLLLKADDGSQRVLETGGSDRFTVVDNTSKSKGDNMKDAIEKNFEIYVKNAFGAYKVADWSAVSKEAAVKEFLAANPSYRNKGIIEAKDSTASKRDGMKDADYEQWTKQGWRVAALYKDGGRIHAIVERKSGDFVVALGYNTSTGEWGQGRYVSTFAAAVDTLNEEKPGAVPIRDSNDASQKGIEIRLFSDGYQIAYVDAFGRQVRQRQRVSENDVKQEIVAAKRRNENVYYFVNADVRKRLGDAVDTLNEEKPGDVPVRDAKPTKKSFEVSFVEDGVTYVRKVKADSIQDAIRKVKDERFSPMTYKKLKELGVSQRQWSGWTQEQANEYIRKHSSNQSKEKTAEATASNASSSMKSLAKKLASSHKEEDIEAFRSELQKYLPDKSKIDDYDEAKDAVYSMLTRMGFEEGKDFVINEKTKLVGHGIKYPTTSALTLRAKPSSLLSESYVASIMTRALNNVFEQTRMSINNSGWTYTFRLDY